MSGEFSQHDFGSVNVSYADGSHEKIHFFASRLKYSRWTHVVTVPDEKVEPLIRALLQSFESFGGVPLRGVFDNPKTIVIGRTKGFIDWNPTFAHVPVDYGFGVELCWPRRANQKGSVENLVGWVKGSFFKVRRFHDRADLEQQLIAWLEEVNLRRPSRATNEIPAERMKAERERLTALAIPAAEYPLRMAVTVRTTERRYFISDLDGRDAVTMLGYVRGHWGIENKVHWLLDVTFREDSLRNRAGHSAENLSRIRRLALNLLRREKTCKIGAKGKRLHAAMDLDYLLQVLCQGI